MSLPLLNEVVAMATGWPRSAAHFFALMTAGGEWGWTSAPVYFFQRSCFLSLSFTASRRTAGTEAASLSGPQSGVLALSYLVRQPMVGSISTIKSLRPLPDKRSTQAFVSG